MKLYHGTNIDFEVIDINKSNPFKDFGKGFYLTDIYEQAKDMALKKSRLFGGIPVVQEYEFDESVLETSGMKILIFKSPCREWATFIYKNRSRTQHYIHEYDIVVGPIADDGVAYLLGRYDEGTLTIEELANELKYKKLNSQYFFGTDKALKLLKRI